MLTKQKMIDLWAGYHNTNENTVQEFIDYTFGTPGSGNPFLPLSGGTITGDLFIQKDVDTFFNCYVFNQNPGTNASAGFAAISDSVVTAMGAPSSNHSNPFFQLKSIFIAPQNSMALIAQEDLYLVAGGVDATNVSAWIEKTDGTFNFEKNITAVNLPTSPVGLPAGSLWNNLGIINVTP